MAKKRHFLSRLMEIFRRKPAEKPTEEKEEEKPEVTAPETVVELSNIRGIGSKKAERLVAAGISSIRDLAECIPEDLAEKVAVSEDTASKWIERAREVLPEK